MNSDREEPATEAGRELFGTLVGASSKLVWNERIRRAILAIEREARSAPLDAETLARAIGRFIPPNEPVPHWLHPAKVAAEYARLAESGGTKGRI